MKKGENILLNLSDIIGKSCITQSNRNQMGFNKKSHKTNTIPELKLLEICLSMLSFDFCTSNK
jgi:hypothetical protein